MGVNLLTGCDFNELSLSAALLAVSKYIRNDFPCEMVSNKLLKLEELMYKAIPDGLEQDERLKHLLDLFYDQWKFSGPKKKCAFSDTLWLDKVLTTRSGCAFSLGTIFLHLAHKINIPLMPVVFPTQLILRADWLDEEMWLIDPQNGETLNENILSAWLKGEFGYHWELEVDYLKQSDNEWIIHNFLLTLKEILLREKSLEQALSVCEIVLEMTPDDPYEIRDRGLIYAQLQCNHVALVDLRYFIQQCPNDPLIRSTRRYISTIKQQQTVLH